MQRFFFGEIIPRQKFAAAMLSRDAILREHPELEMDGNRLKFQKELVKAGHEIEARFGEMNLNNLYWNRTAKELGTSMLLSLGWQLSAIRIYGGALWDMTKNVAHMRDLIPKLQGKAIDHTFLTDRILFAANYTAGSMLLNGVTSYIFSGGKMPEGEDYWFPIIGKNADGSWRRASPVEFTREIASVIQHIKNEGGGVIGGIYGTATYASNKLQPLLASINQAVIQNRNYFGQQIRDPLDTDLQQLWDASSYVLTNSGIPITAKSALQSPDQKDEGLMSAQTVFNFFGFPLAPKWTSRTDTENLILAEYGRLHPEVKTKENVAKQNAYRAYRQALQDNDQEGISTAVDKLRSMGVKDSTLSSFRKHQGTTMEQYFFKKLPKETQAKILARAPEEERKTYAPAPAQ